MLRSAITLVTFSLFISTIPAQTGPGGVGNVSDNGLWLRADALKLNDGDAVDFWPDLSNNVNDAEQSNADFRPNFVATSLLNGMPTVRLDGNNDRLIVADDDILDGTQGITYFAVIRPSNLNDDPRGILGKRTNSNAQDFTYAYTWFFWTTRHLRLDVNDYQERFSTDPIQFTNATNYLLSWDFDGSRPSATRARLYSAGSSIKESSESSTQLTNSPQPLVLGALNDDYRVYLGADYAEVIHYNRALSPLERLIVNNYLSGKYAIPLASGDLYTQDNAANGNYDFDIAGIGRISAADQLTQAQGSGLLNVENPSDLNNNEYFLWGHDGQAATLVSSSNQPGTSERRLARSWRLSEVNSGGTAVDVGAVDVAFDLGGLGFSEENVQLLIDTDNDGNFSDETPLTGARSVGAEVFQFDGVTALADGRRFTIGQASASLPIVLLKVEAYRQKTGGKVVIDWETITETDNDYYAVERAGHSGAWSEIGRVPGGGTTTTVTRYRYVDQRPLPEQTYYRLRQLDFDGRQSLSEVLTVPALAAGDYAAYPNPTTGPLRIRQGGQGSSNDLRIYDPVGREVTSRVRVANNIAGKVDLNLEDLRPGSYFIRYGGTTTRVVKR